MNSVDLRFSGLQCVTVNDEEQIWLLFVPAKPLGVTNEMESAVCAKYSEVVVEVLNCAAQEVRCSFQNNTFNITFPSSKVVQSWVLVSRRVWVLLISFALRVLIVWLLSFNQ